MLPLLAFVGVVTVVAQPAPSSCPKTNDTTGKYTSSVTFAAMPNPSLVPWPKAIELDAGSVHVMLCVAASNAPRSSCAPLSYHAPWLPFKRAPFKLRAPAWVPPLHTPPPRLSFSLSPLPLSRTHTHTHTPHTTNTQHTHTHTHTHTSRIPHAHHIHSLALSLSFFLSPTRSHSVDPVSASDPASPTRSRSLPTLYLLLLPALPRASLFGSARPHTAVPCVHRIGPVTACPSARDHIKPPDHYAHVCA